MEDNSQKKVYKIPAVHTVELKYDALLCLSNPTTNLDDPSDYLDGGDPFDF